MAIVGTSLDQTGRGKRSRRQKARAYPCDLGPRLHQKDLDDTMDELLAPNPVFEIVVGTLIMIVIIFVHGVGIRTFNQRFSKSWIHMNSATPHWRINLLLASTIGSLAALHFAETLLWAAPVSLMGLIPSMRDSYYFVLESYTTLGEGTVSLPDQWRLIGPIMAMSGLFTFGWTGSVLVSIMTEFGKLDRVRAKKVTDGSASSDGVTTTPR